MPQTTDDTDDPLDLLYQVLHELNIVSIGIVVFDGQHYTTHQVGMDKADMLLASHLWQRFANQDMGEELAH